MRQINWGVLGTAGIAEKQTIPGMLQASNCRLYAIAGRSMAKAEDFRARFGFEKAYGSYAELLDDPQVEAVYIPLPHGMHHEWTLKALRAKKHVLCEKPIGVNEQEVREMIAAAEENGVCLMEAFAYLHSPLITEIKGLIDADVIGRPVYIESEFVGSVPDDANFRATRAGYGGSVYDIGCYPTSLALWIFGQEPDVVQAMTRFSHDGIDAYTSMLLGFPGGGCASLQCGMVLAPIAGSRIDRFRIHGTKGSIACDEFFNAEGMLRYTLCTDGVERICTVHAPQNYRLEVEQLGRCITDGETLHVSHAFTLMNARLLDRVLSAIHY